MNSVEQLQIVAEVALAMLLGGLIGFEREIADKPAGLRTHMLVAGAAALLIGVANTVVEGFAGRSDANVSTDPIRTIEAIVAGISFLGAGTILRRGSDGQVEGLTTAASILFAAAIGICVAQLQLVLAIGSTVLVLVALRGVAVIEGKLDRDRPAARTTRGEPARPPAEDQADAQVDGRQPPA